MMTLTNDSLSGWCVQVVGCTLAETWNFDIPPAMKPSQSPSSRPLSPLVRDLRMG
jgi:hypothetical protein